MKFLWLQKVKNSKPWTYVIEDLNGEVIFGTFYEKRIAKDKSNFRKEKVKKKDDRLFVKWKGYDNSFNSWINKKDIVVQKDLFSRTIQS